MKKIIGIIFLTTFLFPGFAQKSEPVSLVNPFVGTGGHGHTFPGATAPFGMVQLSPDTRLSGWDGCSGYHYSDSVIYGFSHTHLSGTGCLDYGDILLMPVSGDVSLKGYDYASSFSHKNEKASPGYYAVLLDKHNINVELTTSTRVGFHKYQFLSGKENSVVLDLQHRDIVLDADIEIVSENCIRGMRRSKAWADDQILFFEIQFSKPFKSCEIKEFDSDGNIIKTDKNKISGKNIKASFGFGNEKQILVKVALSATGYDGAAKNMKKEIPGWDFSLVKKNVEDLWSHELSKIVVKGGTHEQMVNFYTALYHCCISPNIYSDVDGKYLGRDKKIHQAEGFDYYTVFSLWDTYRALHPLLSIIDAKRSNDFIQTFIKQYEQGGLLPVWELSSCETFCMIGYHSVSVIFDSYAKGINNYNVEKAYQAMKNSAEKNHHGLEFLKTYGYLPGDKEHESVSKTLEYAYDDWCIAQMALALGKNGDYEYFIKRAQSYKHIFDTETGFMRPKMNGAWATPFDPSEVTFQYTEANSWQYSFYVPHDINGLINLHGGKQNLLAKLDELFNTKQSLSGRHQADITGLIGQYAHGNEPSHHMAYLYNYLNEPWKTQELANQIMNELYFNKPDGLCGNEDCGQMSAWYVLSALGLYQVCPGNLQFAIASPLFSEANIYQQNGKVFSIKTKNRTEENFYIKSATLNDQAYNKSFIDFNDILNGGGITFDMIDKPNKLFASSDSDVPYTAIAGNYVLPVPYVTQAQKTFTDNIEIEIKSSIPDVSIYYTTDSTIPDFSKQKYQGKITLDKSTLIKAKVLDPDFGYSNTMEAEFIKIHLGRSIKLNTKYNSQYSGGGENAVIDGLRGNNNFRLGAWQGYLKDDFEAIIDLGSKQQIHKLGAGFLQDIASWIWMPSKIIFSISDDNINFTEVVEINNVIADNDYNSIIKDFMAEVNTKGRFVKIKAFNYGKIPEWHLGAGNYGWIFIDEIVIE